MAAMKLYLVNVASGLTGIQGGEPSPNRRRREFAYRELPQFGFDQLRPFRFVFDLSARLQDSLIYHELSILRKAEVLRPLSQACARWR
jgi:hypothetical protein